MTGPGRFALVVGAMKSGTTTLFEVLSQHPEIARCRVKEPEFFSEEAVFANGLGWYRDQWDWDPGRHRVAMEASTGYTKHPQRPGVPERMASVEDVEYRFVYLMRHPLERIESHIRHGLHAGWAGPLDDGFHNDDAQVEISSYASQIERYARRFPRERLLLLTLEEYAADPRGVLARVCRHLGVDDGFRFERVDMRANRGERYDAPRFVDALQGSRPYRRLETALTRRFRRLRGKTDLWRVVPGRVRRGRYRLDPSERAAIIDRLAPDLRRLRRDYGIDTGRYWRLEF